VSAGIAEALVTTAFGLLVAIPAVMIYNYFQGWVDAATVDIAESSNELLDLVARQLKSNAAGRPAAVRHG
jgi:biopolymer transport protein ExbB/biopolymer transport protein TolQ